MTWGGQREGSGRRPRMYKRECRSFRLTDEEYQILKPLVEAIRTRTDASNKQHLEYLNNKILTWCMYIKYLFCTLPIIATLIYAM